MPTKLDVVELAYVSILNALLEKKNNADTEIRTIRKVVGSPIRHLTADQSQYRVKKAISDVPNLNLKYRYFLVQNNCVA